MAAVGMSSVMEQNYNNHVEYEHEHEHEEQDAFDSSYADQSERQEPTEEVWREML